MNPRDIPEVVAELIYEMHEVRSELTALNGRVDRLEQTMGQVVSELQTMPDRLSAAMFKSLEPFLTRILDNNDQLKSHETRLNNLENPQA